jgi:hypothetical protein
MAIGYRFTSQELATLIDLLGISHYRLLDIDVDNLTELEKQNCQRSLCNKKILIRHDKTYSMDKIIRVIVSAVSCAESYTVSVRGEAVIIYNFKIVLLLYRDKHVKNVWHIYPYSKFVDLIMDEHGKFEQLSDWLYVTPDNEELITWGSYIERMVKDE